MLPNRSSSSFMGSKLLRVKEGRDRASTTGASPTACMSRRSTHGQAQNCLQAVVSVHVRKAATEAFKKQLQAKLSAQGGHVKALATAAASQMTH
jgi:hypothetical protein